MSVDRGPTRESSRQIAAWSGYNWANHAWAAPVAAVLIGPWMLALAKHAAGGDRGVLLALGPVPLRADAFPSTMVTVAALLQLALLPPLGIRADARRAKRRYLAMSCAAGSIICLLLSLTSGGAWVAAGLLFLAGSVIEGVSDVAWQGILPEIAGPGECQEVSVRGTAIGYLGAATILVFDLLIIGLHGPLGLTKSAAVRLCFLGAGLWWCGFGLPAVRRLAPTPRPLVEASTGGLIPEPGSGWAAVLTCLRQLRTRPQTRRFLVAYLFISDGTSAVIALSSTFLTHQLFGDNTDRAATFLFALILLIQIVAMGGAVLFGRIARMVGAKPVVVGCLIGWCAVIVYSFAALDSKVDAVGAGVVIGAALGATTALTRSMFAQMVPPGQEATYFSLYETCNQGTAWIAPLLFTLVVTVTGSFRQAVLSLLLVFSIGLVTLIATDCDAATTEATRPINR